MEFYRAHEALLALNVDAHVGALALRGAELSLADVTSEVAAQSATLSAMAEQLQSSVNLGLVQLNCTKARAAAEA